MTTSARRAAASGDDAAAHRLLAPEALEEFHRRFFLPLVRRAAWKHGLSKEDARDVVQEAFLLAILKLDPGGNPTSWLIGVVDRLSVNFQRKVARRAQLAAKWGLPPGGDEVLDAAYAGGPDEDLGEKW